ncbi:MAG: T9SS type A sorting domain-containing protein, partial [Bacteroidales bacterium]|nr:T9SS type A sorting domain-containing protein [Bacteroidales bacterium]
IEVAAGTNVSSLTPTISVSDKASVDPASGVSRDFSGVVTYTVTAEDLSTQEWTVNLSVAPYPSSAKEITAFSLVEQTGIATIDLDNHTVDIEVEPGTNISSLTPTISVSDNAGIDPASGVARDFSTPLKYIVTAEDLTTQEWIVKVQINKTSIKQLQAPLITFAIQPNPAKGNFEVLFEKSMILDGQIEIYNQLGKKVYSCNVKKGVEKVYLDTSEFTAGFYSVVINDQSGIVGAKKLILL